MNFQPLKNFMDRLTAWRIPGNSISVRLDGKEVFRYMSGYSDIETKTPMSENLLFNIYSCSKVATVTAALQLYEKGYFLLDDPLYNIIPEYSHMYIKTAQGELVRANNPITLRHLFTMTAGLDYNTSRDSIQKTASQMTDGKMDTLTVAKCLASDPLSFEPGEKWQYSLCHDVLAAVVEVVSGKKFRDYVKENIFEPLEMYDSRYHTDESLYPRVCSQYNFVDVSEGDIVKLQAGEIKSVGGKIEKVDKSNTLIFGPEYDSGGAGITTSVEDYSKFAAALARGGLGINGNRILSSGTVELLRTNQLTSVQQPYLNWLQLRGYGYGLGVRTLIDKAVSGTTGNLGEFGWGGAAGATVLVDPDIKLSVFYTHHMLNPQEHIYQPRLRNVVYTCLNS